MNRAVTTFFLLGLFLGSGPCLASCGPLLVSYFAGTRKGPLPGLVFYVIFSFGRILAYLALSLALFFFGRLAAENVFFPPGSSRYVLILGAVFIVAIGISLVAGKERGGFCEKLYGNLIEKDGKSALLLGLFAGLSPCAPLLAALSYAGLISKSLWLAVVSSFAFGMGTVLSPLLLMALAAGTVPGLLLKKSKTAGDIFRVACGLGIVFLGLQLGWRAFHA